MWVDAGGTARSACPTRAGLLDTQRLVCGTGVWVGVARAGIRAKDSPSVGMEWAEVPLRGPSPGGWPSETKVSLESAPPEAVRVTLYQATPQLLVLLATFFYHFLARQHCTQIAPFESTWHSPCVRVPLLTRMPALLHEGPR